MSFSGLDSTGGAGLQADIETCSALGCHCSPVATVLTAQDTRNAIDYLPVNATFIIEQARAILEDFQVNCFKIGLISSIAVVETLHTLLNDYKHIPAVLDPVISAGGGAVLCTDEVVEAIKQLLLPLTTIIVPNTIEAKQLAPEADTIEACAYEILEHGCNYVLITGSHEPSQQIVNRLYGYNKQLQTFTWERLHAQYHGSGCTLAAALASYIAQGFDIISASREAQGFTWKTLKHGQRIGMGQLIPNRLFWADTPQE